MWCRTTRCSPPPRLAGSKSVSGWNYRSSKDTTPSAQYCYAHVGRTGRLELAEDGKLLSTIDTDARALGVDPGMAETLTKSCRWFSPGAPGSRQKIRYR